MSNPDAASLLEAARAILPWMREVRRDLHRHPELGFEEHRTAARVQRELDGLGVEFEAGLAGTGILATLAAGSPGRVVALRADLDALPMQDAKAVEYRSQVDGRMHACGHDVHTTIALGAARLLAGCREEWSGTVKLIFQPAEETTGGARLLIEAGVLERPAVDAIFGLHVDPGFDVGSIGLRYGQRNAASDLLSITVHGRSGHGAYPASGVDAIVAAAQVVTAVQTVVSRSIDARASAVVTIGTIHGGTQGNILANEVRMTGTIRTLDPTIRETVVRRVSEVAEGVATGLGARAEVEIVPSYDPVINADAMIDVVRSNATELLGADRVQVIHHANMGAEDFGFYLARVPGAFFSLGVRNETRGIVYPIHHERFDVDEECMAYGAALQAMNALAVLSGDDGRALSS
jgi:amidohydrolase